MSLLLDRPFFKMVHTKFDIFDGILTIEFDGKIIRFNILDAINPANEMQVVVRRIKLNVRSS